MSYTPQKNTNIWKIYQSLTDEFTGVQDIKKKATQLYPDIPGGFTTHLNFLVGKKLVERRLINELYHYRLIKGESRELVVSTESLSTQYLNYCKSRVGQTVTAQELCSHFHKKLSDTSPGTILVQLKKMGVVQIVENTRPYQYLILPAIQDIDKVDWSKPKNGEVVKKPPKETNDIANMSIGEMLTSYMSLKEENVRLKSVLRRLAAELMSEIELDH